MTSTAHQLDQLAISPSGFVFDQRTGATFTVNDTGRTLIERIRDGATLEELVVELKQRFDVAPGIDLRRDVLEYVRSLQDSGLLPPGFELE